MRRGGNKRGGRDSRGGGGRDSGSKSYGGFRSDFGSDRSFSRPREMHKATCADCKSECEVPFKPTEGKPVYCRECFAKHRPKRF